MRTTTPLAQAIYERDAREAEGKTGDELATKLERSKRELEERQEAAGEDIRDERLEIREELQDVLENPVQGKEEVQKAKEDIDEKIAIVRGELGRAVIEHMQENAVGKANLGTDGFWVDPTKIEDKEHARSVRKHEEEHMKQSATANAKEIKVGNRTFEAWKVREAGALAMQGGQVEKTSAEYQDIHRHLNLTRAQVQLVRDGKFKELEAEMN